MTTRQYGARGKLVMQPPFGRDGHRMFASSDGLPIWTAEFDRFLREINFPTTPGAEPARNR